jgi:hypothetical protein
MPYENWPSVIVPPQDGEPVDNQTTARAHESLSDRTEYLKQRLVDYSSSNGRILIPSVLLESEVSIGDAVYYNPLDNVYGQAIAEGTIDAETGLLSSTPRTFAIGICVTRSGNYGDILVSGASNLLSDFLVELITLVLNSLSLLLTSDLLLLFLRESSLFFFFALFVVLLL